MLKKLTSLFILFVIVQFFGFKEAKSAHMYGGNISYVYVKDTLVGGNTQHIYEVIMTVYYDCSDRRPGRYPYLQSETIAIYEGGLNVTTLPLSAKVTDLQLNWVDSVTLEANLPNGCASPTSLCVGKVNYSARVVLPSTFIGYHFVFDRCCRTVIQNITGTLNTVGTLFHSWTASTATKNSSPRFRDLQRPFLCAGQNKAIVNLALDKDGNQLNYSFYQPYDGSAASPNPLNYRNGYTNWPPKTVTYQTGHNLSNPFGPTGSASINGITGLTSLKAATVTGPYVIGVRVKEIDNNGFTVGVVNREFQFPVISCSDTNKNTPNLITGSKTDHEIEAGDSLCFDIEFESKGANLAFEYAVNGEPFLSTTVPTATQTTPIFIGKKSKQTICWNTSCPQGRPSKYFFTAAIADSACLPGDTAIVYSVLVKPFTGPKTINGLANMCAGSPSVTYTTDTITGASYSWKITGGTIVSGGTGPSITVNWGNGPGGNVRVSANSQFGCPSDSIDLPVNVITFPVNPGKDQTICFGDTVTLGSTGGAPTAPSGFGIKWAPSSSLDFDTVQNPRAFPSTSTKYSIKVTDTTGLCFVTDTVTITVLQNTNAGISTKDTTICEGDTVQLQAFGGRFYKWQPTNAVTNDTIINPKTTISKTTSISVIITDTGKACPALDTVLITVDSKGQVSAGIDSSICLGQTYTLGQSPNGPTGSTYLWSPVTNLSSSTLDAPVYTPVTSGLVRYQLQVTTPRNCVFLDTVQVRTDTLPKLILEFKQDTICLGQSDTMNVRGAVNYSWTPSSLPQNQSFQFVTPTVTTKYVVTGTDLNFCSSKDSHTVVVNPLPEILIPQDSVFLCLGDTMTLSTTTGATSYSWSPATALTPNATVSNPVAKPNVTTTYTVTITDLNGCDNVDSIYILVDDTIPVDAGLDKKICLPDSALLGGSPTSLLFRTSFNWTPGDSLTDSTSSNPTSFVQTDKQYIVTARNGICVGFDTVNVSVSKGPEVKFSKSAYEICKGDSTQIMFSASTASLKSHSWSPITGLGDTTINPKSSPDTTTLYTLIVIDTLGCIGSGTTTVKVSNKADIFAGNDTIACEGSSITLNVTGGVKYAWQPGSELDDSTIATPTATLTSKTTFIVAGENALGCVGLDTIVVDITKASKIDAGGPFIYCSDTISNITLGGNPTGPAKSSYSWSSPTLLDNPSIANPKATAISNTYYLLVKDSNGCISNDSAIVSGFSFNVNSTTIKCNGDSAKLLVYEVGGTGPYTYKWTPNYALTSDSIANPISNPDSSVLYQVLVIDSLGCKDSTDVYVNVDNVVKAIFDFTIKAGCDSAVGLSNNKSENADDFKWYVNGAYYSDGYDIRVPLKFGTATSVKLIAGTNGSCSDSSSVSETILAFEDYFDGNVPNVFTPDGDGFNDLFDVQVGQRLEKCTKIAIYNRWGVLVFESYGNNHSWDGRTFTGEECTAGVYLFTMDVNGTPYKGTVTLIRQ